MTTRVSHSTVLSVLLPASERCLVAVLWPPATVRTKSESRRCFRENREIKSPLLQYEVFLACQRQSPESSYADRVTQDVMFVRRQAIPERIRHRL